MSNLKDWKIIAPNLDLFVYDLREGLGQSEAEIAKNRYGFWQKIYPQLDDAKIKELAEKEQSDRDFIRLLKHSKTQEFQSGIDGWCYAALLNDVYALQIDCFCEESGQHQTIKTFDYFATLKSSIEAQFGDRLAENNLNFSQGTLGQTSLIWGKIDRDNLTSKEVEEIARLCYENYTSNGDWAREKSLKSGQFLGGTIFEAWHSPPGWENPADYRQGYHVVIWLFPAQFDIKKIESKIAKAYLDFLYLFSYRSKILWAYHQSRMPTSQLKQDFQDIESLIKTIGQLDDRLEPKEIDLKNLSHILKETLTMLSRYALKLSDLECQNRTLQTNLQNYRQRLEKLTQFDTQSNLEIWCDFADFTQQKYQGQIESNLAYFQPGLTLLENLIRTIEGTIDIYQTAGERRLNLTVASVGTGLAVSSVVVSVIATEPPPDKPVFFNKPHLTQIGISLFWGLVALLLTWRGLKWYVRSSKS